jgi:hypothetical protein
MSMITVPDTLKTAFVGDSPAKVCDKEGNVLGYYMPRRDATAEDYAWALQNVTTEELEYSASTGVGRPLSEIIADLRQRFG